MKLSELNEAVQRQLKGNGDAEVMITLSEPSVGCRAFSRVTSAGLGFDWEADQFRIEPEEKLTTCARGRDNPIPAYRVTYPGSEPPDHQMPEMRRTSSQKQQVLPEVRAGHQGRRVPRDYEMRRKKKSHRLFFLLYLPAFARIISISLHTCGKYPRHSP